MTPSETLEAYLNAWKAENWFEMARLLQKTARVHKYGPAKLKEELSQVRLISFEITGAERKSTVWYAIPANIVISFRGIRLEKCINASVIKESHPGEPDIRGEWGVNPISAQGFRDR